MVPVKEHPNARLIRRGYECFARGDIETLREIMDHDAVWHEPGRSRVAGDHKGAEGVLGFLRRLKELTAGTFRAEIVDMVVDVERVVVFQRDTAERDGELLDVLAVVDYEIHHGRVTEATVYQYDQYRFDDFFA